MSPHNDDDPRSLVPLSTLQHTLYRQLYPFDISPDVHLMALPVSPSSHHPQPSTSPPPLSQTSSSEIKPSSTSDPSSAAAMPDERHQCQWVNCSKVFSDPEALYNHLCNDHIGRKSTGNLCLTCKWKDCGTSCAKRDHITSHLRVHTPLKPHVCMICKKPFKRPQDLKKHEKIHTEEHHAQHKHSKAITVADPAFASRVLGDNPPMDSSESPPHAKPRGTSAAHTLDRAQAPVARAKSNSVSASDGSSGGDYGMLPTPSPEIDQAAIRYPNAESAASRTHLYHMQNQLPTWEVLSTGGNPSRSTTGSGAKRAHDYAVDDFFTDVKKRRVNPAYDSNMAARLNNIAYQHSLSPATAAQVGPPAGNPGFNPRSVSFDIRSPEELAAVNEFLVTLGRDVAAGGNAHRQQQQQHPQSQAHHIGSAVGDPSSPQSYFDPATLSQLGLAGMPGIPTAPGPGSGAEYHGDAGYLSVDLSSHHLPPSYPSRASHQSVQPVQYGAYPSAQDIASSGQTGYPPVNYSAGSRSRGLRVSSSPSLEDRYGSAVSPTYGASSMQQSMPHLHYLTPPLEGTLNSGASPLSSHSASSTPPNDTPPHIHASIPFTLSPETVAAFDYLRPNRAPPPVQLAPVDYMGQTMRTIVPLQGAPSSSVTASRPEPVEPKLSTASVHRGPPAKLTAEAVSSLSTPASLALPPSSSKLPGSTSASGSLYPLLTSGDDAYKLPPLNSKYRSPSPSLSSPLSRASTLSPPPHARSRTQHDSPAGSPVIGASARASPSPPPQQTVLPSIHSIARAPPPRRRDSEELARAVGRIELDSRAMRETALAQRTAHARLVRDLLVSINTEYRRQFGAPPARGRARGETRDVEMCAA
ncbi:hypothetical protein AcW1_001265 [Taiwanofungus camphoratus]|nr:hypothetical protein AcW1_001265 [Antrodia cinnamomea]